MSAEAETFQQHFAGFYNSSDNKLPPCGEMQSLPSLILPTFHLFRLLRFNWTEILLTHYLPPFLFPFSCVQVCCCVVLIQRVSVL